ncbi:MAG TPA: nucleoside triphosphate pyrophosphohydrolase [Candidatus Limnocylindria bacterium]|nr:nucleoside triphosphate pyrophosphohydrolase [Candidatus Limnocylindria bacterium]
MLDALVAEARDRWGLDPSAGIQIVATESLTATPIEASRPLLLLPRAWLEPGAAADERLIAGAPTPAGEPLAGRHGAEGRDPVRVLKRLYPGDATVARLGTASTSTGPAELTVAELTGDDLDGALYVAPIAPELAAAGPWAMPYISNRLRQPDGCAWDREQTHDSLRKHLLEETYEVYDALEHGATPALAEELGDLLLQVVLHAQLAAEAGVFDLADVQASIARKIVRRHPHVFGDAVARTSADVNRQWERIKAGERESAAIEAAAIEAAADGAEAAGGAVGGAAPAPKSALDGISPSMPALAASQEMQERAAALGYDWPSIDGVLDKVAEELGELARAETTADRREEFGDLLLVAVNVGRKLGIEAEAALRAANHKFRSRFARVERMARERGVALRDLDFAALDHLWDAAKAEERAAAADPPPAVTSEGVR